MSLIVSRGFGYGGTGSAGVTRVITTCSDEYGGSGFVDRTPYSPMNITRESDIMFKPTYKKIANVYKNSLIQEKTTPLNGIIYENGDKLYQNNIVQLNIPKNLQSSIKITIEEQYEFRVDSLAYKYYNDERYYWVILSHNNIIDPFELEIGTILELPSKSVIDKALDSIKQYIKLKRNTL